MKKILLLIAIISCSLGCFSQDKFLLIKATANDEFYGYTDSTGREVIPCIYPFAYTDTLKTIAFVIDTTNELIAINSEGKKLFNVYLFDNGPDYLSDGLFRIVHDNKVGYANMDGEIIIEPQFFAASPFTNSLAKVSYVGETQKTGEHIMTVNGKWGIINKKGELLLPCYYDEIHFLENGKIELSIDNKMVSIIVENVSIKNTVTKSLFYNKSQLFFKE